MSETSEIVALLQELSRKVNERFPEKSLLTPLPRPRKQDEKLINYAAELYSSAAERQKQAASERLDELKAEVERGISLAAMASEDRFRFSVPEEFKDRIISFLQAQNVGRKIIGSADGKVHFECSGWAN